jgi:Glycosyltransferase sugar-binding region containing DXD motif
MPGAIPRQLNRIWLGPDPIPDLYETYWAEWQRLHPDWSFCTWDDELALTGIMGVAPEGSQIYQIWRDLGWSARSCGVPMSPTRATAVQRADIGGYLIAYLHGGVYINCDMLPLRNIEPLLDGHECVLGLEDDTYVVNAFMAATPGHPLLEQVVQTLPDSCKKYGASGMEIATGPHHLTRCIHRYAEQMGLPQDGLSVLPGPGDRFTSVMTSDHAEVCIVDPAYLYPVHHSQIPYGTHLTEEQIAAAREAGAYTVHGWGHRWQEGRKSW